MMPHKTPSYFSMHEVMSAHIMWWGQQAAQQTTGGLTKWVLIALYCL